VKAIGVFDSGIGGLTVVKELARQLPYEDIVYLGDTARVPYGTKSESTIVRFTLENILFLLRQDVKFIVIACNTASSIALELVKKYFQIPIIGVIKPGAKQAVRVTRNKRVGVIGTAATIRTAAYESQIRRLDPSIKVTSCACPLFVPLVEEGQRNQKIIFDAASQYLKPLKKARVDTLILGCTHYPLLKPVIKKVMGRDIILVDSALQVASEVRAALAAEGILNVKRPLKNVKRIFNVTDEPRTFLALAERFLGYTVNKVKKVDYV